jgi:ribose-phosphate pyrophosphokinase
MSNISFVDNQSLINFTSFSDGTETCKILQKGSMVGSHIQVNIENGTRDIIRICLVKDALSRMGIDKVKLTVGYFPQARADRVFDTGNPLPVKVFTDIINSCNFEKVYIYDPHSDVLPALLNNVHVIQQAFLVKDMLPYIKRYLPDFTLCAPDLGSTKKIFDLVMLLGLNDYIQGIKIRNVKNGDIVKSSIDKETIFGSILIVDDIADGGASFTHLAKTLKERGATRVGLYVTHGIFSKGLDCFSDSVDYIFCQNIVGNYITDKDLSKFNSKV